MRAELSFLQGSTHQLCRPFHTVGLGSPHTGLQPGSGQGTQGDIKTLPYLGLRSKEAVVGHSSVRSHTAVLQQWHEHCGESNRGCHVGWGARRPMSWISHNKTQTTRVSSMTLGQVRGSSHCGQHSMAYPPVHVPVIQDALTTLRLRDPEHHCLEFQRAAPPWAGCPHQHQLNIWPSCPEWAVESPRWGIVNG